MDQDRTSTTNTLEPNVIQQTPTTGTREVLVILNRRQAPTPGMDPQVTLELLAGSGSKKAIGHVTVYHAFAIHGIAVVEKDKRRFVRMPRAPKGARARHSDIAYPLNKAARECLYGAVLAEYDRLAMAAEAQRQQNKLMIPE